MYPSPFYSYYQKANGKEGTNVYVCVINRHICRNIEREQKKKGMREW